MKKMSFKKIAVVFLLITLIIFYLFDEVYSAEVSISIAPFHAPEKIWHLYNPFIEYLNKNTNIKWQLKIYPTHEEIKKALCNGEIAIALFGPVLAYQANKDCNAEPLILVLNEDGKPNFSIYIVTADKNIKSVKQLKGLKIGLFKPATAADLVSRKLLDEEGINEENSKFIVYQNLERIVNDIMTDEIKAGSIRNFNYISFKHLAFQILKKSEPLPGFAFMSLPTIDPKIKKQFINALLKLNSLEKNKLRKITSGWDETIKYGFSFPDESFLKEVEKFIATYEKYKK
jgi:ABC-type phosphate/phosphonate transport system substrate-binding protein